MDRSWGHLQTSERNRSSESSTTSLVGGGGGGGGSSDGLEFIDPVGGGRGWVGGGKPLSGSAASLAGTVRLHHAGVCF